MQISNGTFIIQGAGINVVPGIVSAGPVSNDPNVSLGTTVTWNSNTFLYIAGGQANITAQDYIFDTNYMVYQLFYAHQSIRLPTSTGSGFRWSTITRQGGNNTYGLYGVASSSDNTKGNFNSNVETVIGNLTSFNYSGNVLSQGNVNQQFVIPAKRYFLMGITGGPFYKNYRKTSNNYTAVYNGNAIVTAIPEVYTQGWPSGVNRGVPNQLGGNTSGYTKLVGNILLAAFKFEVV